MLLPVQCAAGVAEEALDQRHHVVEVAVGLVQFQQRELGIMAGRDAFVAEDPPDLIDAVEAADDQPLEVEFQRDPQVQFDIQRVVVGQERACRRAAGDGLQDGRLDFQIRPDSSRYSRRARTTFMRLISVRRASRLTFRST